MVPVSSITNFYEILLYILNRITVFILKTYLHKTNKRVFKSYFRVITPIRFCAE